MLGCSGFEIREKEAWAFVYGFWLEGCKNIHFMRAFIITLFSDGENEYNFFRKIYRNTSFIIVVEYA